MSTTPAGPATDAELVGAMAAGDEGALGELYERHAGWLSIRLMRRCNNPDLVAETLQDTFLAVWRGADRWRGEGEVAAWLWGIGMRRLVSLMRKPDRARLLASLGTGEPVEPSAEEQALLAVEHGDLGAAMATLSPELRAVIQLTVLDGLTERDTARLLGLPLGTAKGRIRKAKRLLADAVVGSQMKEGWT